MRMEYSLQEPANLQLTVSPDRQMASLRLRDVHQELLVGITLEYWIVRESFLPLLLDNGST